MTLFAGFADLDQWIRHIDQAQPVYALSLGQTHHGSHGHATQTTHVILSQPAPGGSTVYYVRIRTAQRNFVAGQPWDDDSAERHHKAITAWRQALAYLADHGIETVPAAIATPADLTLLEADAGTIPSDYDLATMTCYNCEAAGVEATHAWCGTVQLKCPDCGEETSWQPVHARRAPTDA